MRKMMKAIAAVLAVSALMAGSAFGAEKLAVKDTLGSTTVFAVDELGTATAKKIGVGTTNPISAIHAMETSSTDAFRGILSAQHSTGPQAAQIQFRKSYGTESVPLAVANGAYIGAFDTQAYDGSAYLNPAAFGFAVDNTVSTGSVPTAFTVFTGYKIGNPGRAERFRVASDGRLRLSNQPAAPAMTSACTAGDLILDAPGAALYLCTASGAWRKATFTTY